MKDTLLVCFGRVRPYAKMNKDNAAIHWGQAASLFFAGAGVSPGRSSARPTSRAPTRPDVRSVRPISPAPFTRLWASTASGSHDPDGRPVEAPTRARSSANCMHDTPLAVMEDIHAEHRRPSRLPSHRIPRPRGLSLANLLQAGEAKRVVKDKSVIFLFQHGGPAQTETFDPKMPLRKASAASRVRSRRRSRRHLRQHLHEAGRAGRQAVDRPFVHTGDANHDIKPVVGRDSFGPTSFVYSRVAGQPIPRRGCRPASTCSRAPSIPRENRSGRLRPLRRHRRVRHCLHALTRGRQRAAEDMKLSLPMDRLDDRRRILSSFDQVSGGRRSARRRSIDRVRQQAFSTILGGVADAFDLSKETHARSPATTPPARPAENIDKKWNNYKFYVDNSKTLGKLLLLARRLCERGPASSRSPRISSGTCTPTSTTPGRRGDHEESWQGRGSTSRS